MTQAGYPEDHLDTLYSHQNCEVTGWAQTSVMSHQCDTLPGDSGSPLMLHTDDGWQLIGVQSSAPAAKDRWRADNRAISVTVFATSWINCRKNNVQTLPDSAGSVFIRQVSP